MLHRHTALIVVTATFVAAVGLALASHGTGVIRNDVAHNRWIPDELTMPLQMQAAYDDQRMYFRYRWPAPRPHIANDLLRFHDGQWRRQERSPVGPDPDGNSEDRLAMMVDDGSVPEFEHYGGYITVGAQMRDFNGSGADAAHRRKYLPATRRNPDDWYSIVDAKTLEAQRRAGYFLDLWHWRAQLSNPLDRSDDQSVSWFRLFDAGGTPYFSNWDPPSHQPRWMFDPQRTGIRALRWDDVAHGRAVRSKPYFLTEAVAVPFDPGLAWREGDVLPGEVLREPTGSRADIRVQGHGRWSQGYWDVTLVRALDTGHPLDDKILRDQRIYSVALAVHRDARASRWHYVSLPFQVGLGRKADLVAMRMSGPAPDWKRAEVHEVTLFYPGQVSWQHLTSARHAGSKYVAKGVPVKYRHKETQLASYGVEMEFDREIRLQWWLTLAAGLMLIVSFVFSVARLLRGREGG